MKTNKIITMAVIITLLSALLLLGISCSKKKKTNTLKEKLETWGLKSKGVSGFKIIKKSAINLDSLRLERLTAKKTSTHIRMERITKLGKKQAQKYMRDETLLFESIFASKPAPYPGAITKKIEPAKKFQPIKVKLKNRDFEGVMYIVYAGQRYNYGVTTDDLAVYKAALAFLRSKKDNIIYKIEIFKPKNDPLNQAINIIKSLSRL